MSGRGNTPFDRLLKQQCQKGAISASKSAGLVGRWGAASFTSLRGARNNGAEAPGASLHRPNKFFKSRAQSAVSVDEDVCEAIVPEETATAAAHAHKRPAQQPPATSAPKRNKFFTSKRPKEPTPPPAPAPAPAPTPPQQVRVTEEPLKIPPLKLKIKAPVPPSQAPLAPASSAAAAATASAAGAHAKSSRRGGRRPARSSDSSQSSSSSEEEEEEDNGDDDEEEEDVKVEKGSVDEVQVTQEEQVEEEKPARVQPIRSYGRRGQQRQVATKQVKQEVVEEKVAEPPEVEDGVGGGGDEEDPEVSFKDAQQEEDDGPEISFKDDSLVMKSPNSKSQEVQGGSSSVTETTVTNAGDAKVKIEEREPWLTMPVPDDDPKKEGVVEPSREPAVDSAPSAGSSSSQPDPPSAAASSGGSSSSFPRRKAIFKSKRENGGGAGGKKGLGLYRHKWNSGPLETEEDFRKEVMTRAVLRGLPKDGMDFDDEDSDQRVPPLPGAFRQQRQQDDPPPTEMSFATSKLVRVASAPGAPAARMGAFDETVQEVVSVKCPKEQKDYYMVIKNVKKAHQIQDSGEFQEFNDDVDYILGGLGARNSLSTRCLSTITLASKCMEPSFRMHLRAHGTVTKFFGELRDAPKNSSLALCASTVLFVLSQDRLNMDLDRDSLELMLNLLDTDSKIKDALVGSGMDERELQKNKQKVEDLVAAMKKKGHAVNLSLDQISADHLSMETLLSLTSKRAGEWFKEELRDLGGLDHLVRTLSDCVAFLTDGDLTSWNDQLHDKLRKADRVLKVLENVTHENEENCLYLLKYREGEFLQTVHKLFRLLDEEVPLNPSFDLSADKDSVCHSLREATFDVIRVYINLVHDYHSTPFGSDMAGKLPGLFDATLHCLFVLPESMPSEKQFDILVLALTLLINLVENCVPNRVALMRSRVPDRADTFTAPSERTSAHAGMIAMFLEKEESARVEESKTNNILDGVKEEDGEEQEEEAAKKEEAKSQEERIEETVAKLLHKAGRHMEDTLIGSYITLIIGYLILDDKDRETEVRSHLPEGNFALMVAVLKKFFNFMNLTASATLTSSRGLKATETIIKYLEKIDAPVKEEGEQVDVKKEGEESFEDLTVFDVSKDEEEEVSSRSSFTLEKGGFFPDDDFGKL